MSEKTDVCLAMGCAQIENICQTCLLSKQSLALHILHVILTACACSCIWWSGFRVQYCGFSVVIITSLFLPLNAMLFPCYLPLSFLFPTSLSLLLLTFPCFLFPLPFLSLSSFPPLPSHSVPSSLLCHGLSDLKYTLLVQVWDHTLSITLSVKDNLPQSDVNKEYFLLNKDM